MVGRLKKGKICLDFKGLQGWQSVFFYSLRSYRKFQSFVGYTAIAAALIIVYHIPFLKWFQNVVIFIASS
jgi:hypothetical protein